MPQVKREIKHDSEDEYVDNIDESPSKRAKTTQSPKGKRTIDPATNATFSAEYKAILTKASILHLIANRPALYKTEGLEPVSGNGGDKINKQLQVLLRALCKAGGVDEEFVKEAVKAKGKGRKGD